MATVASLHIQSTQLPAQLLCHIPLKISHSQKCSRCVFIRLWRWLLPVLLVLLALTASWRLQPANSDKKFVGMPVCVYVGNGGACIRRGLQPYGLSQPFTVFGSLAPNQIGIYLHATSLFSNMVDVGWGRDDILRRPSAHSPFTLHAFAIEPTPYSNCTAYYWKIELHFTCRARNYHIFMHHTELLPGCISIDFANAMIVAIQCIPCNMHGLLLFHG